MQEKFLTTSSSLSGPRLAGEGQSGLRVQAPSHVPRRNTIARVPVPTLALGLMALSLLLPLFSKPATNSVVRGLSSALPIEKIRVGQRVWADNPDGRSTASRVDPTTWRRLRLQAHERWADGTLDDIHVETLQPPEWVAEHQAEVGATVPLPLDLVDMGLPEELPARVIANEPCPPIKKGPGRIVLTTVNHLNPDVREVTVEDDQERVERIRPTGFHKFYRLPERRWVSAKELAAGDQLQGKNRRLRVAGVTRVPGVHRVYNLTVEGEHVYYVSSLGVLGHNNNCGPGQVIVQGGPFNQAGRVIAPAGSTPFQIASQGGRHAGFLQNYAGRSASEIQRSIASLEARAAQHAGKAANPAAHAADWATRNPQAQQGLINYWLRESQTYREQAAVLRGLLGGG